MIVKATTKRLRVDYRTVGKFYNQGSFPEGDAPVNTAEKSDFPFDSIDVEVGHSFDTEGVELVRVVEYTETPESAPVMGG